MALRADSYGTVAEIEPYTRYILSGEVNFSANTKPTLTEVEGFIDKISGVLNSALRGAGFSIPITNSTAKLMLDDWVITKTVERVELTQPGVGFNDGDTPRTRRFRSLYKDAQSFVAGIQDDLDEIVGMSRATSAGLIFTGQNKRSERSDPTNTTLEQPFFHRRQFDTPNTGTNNDVDEDSD